MDEGGPYEEGLNFATYEEDGRWLYAFLGEELEDVTHWAEIELPEFEVPINRLMEEK